MKDFHRRNSHGHHSCISGGGRRPDLLLQQLVIHAVQENVRCCLFRFSTGAPGGWHEAESVMHVLVQLVVPGSQTEDDHLFWPWHYFDGSCLAGVAFCTAQRLDDDRLHLCVGDLGQLSVSVSPVSIFTRPRNNSLWQVLLVSTVSPPAIVHWRLCRLVLSVQH